MYKYLKFSFNILCNNITAIQMLLEKMYFEELWKKELAFFNQPEEYNYNNSVLELEEKQDFNKTFQFLLAFICETTLSLVVCFYDIVV